MPIPESIAAFIDQQAKRAPAAYDDLRVVIFNGTTNMLHLARMLKDHGGIPAYGNSNHDWNLEQEQHPNPEYR
jgi:hypothetical protein